MPAPTIRQGKMVLRAGDGEYIDYRKRQVEEFKKTPEFQESLRKRKAKLLERLKEIKRG